MNLQETILKQYQSTFNNPPLRETSERTGIHLTRVFRIINGAPMKLHEYESFKSVLNETRFSKTKQELLSLIDLCETTLSDNGINEVKKEISRRLDLSKLLEGSNLYNPNESKVGN